MEPTTKPATCPDCEVDRETADAILAAVKADDLNDRRIYNRVRPECEREHGGPDVRGRPCPGRRCKVCPSAYNARVRSTGRKVTRLSFAVLRRWQDCQNPMHRSY